MLGQLINLIKVGKVRFNLGLNLGHFKGLTKKKYNFYYLGAAILSGSDPPMSLDTILPASRALARSIWEPNLEESPKMPNFETLTAFSGTWSLTSKGT